MFTFHWFSSVPSQTWCNLAFWHAATSNGSVLNPDNVPAYLKWVADHPSPTLFNALSASPRNLDWRVYLGNELSLTEAIHFASLSQFPRKAFPPLEQFFTDCANGELPAYSFLEPTFFTPNNDQHPPSFDSQLDAVRTSSDPTGNNWSNTLLVITYDEHGGCYDHVPPPTATPPDAGGRSGELGFSFDRLGVRVPTVMISAHIAPGTVVNTVHDHTSFLRTMTAKWNLTWNGRGYFTERDRTARPFNEVFRLAGKAPRDVSTWPGEGHRPCCGPPSLERTQRPAGASG